MFSSFPTYSCELGGQRWLESSTCCFPCTEPNGKAFPTFPTRTQRDLHLYQRLPAKGRHQRLSLKQSQGTTPLALPLAEHKCFSFQILSQNPASTHFPDKKNHFHICLPCTRKTCWQITILPVPFHKAGTTGQDAKSVCLHPSKASSQIVNAAKSPPHPLSPTHHTHYTAHTYFQGGRTQLQTTCTENNH